MPLVAYEEDGAISVGGRTAYSSYECLPVPSDEKGLLAPVARPARKGHTRRACLFVASVATVAVAALLVLDRRAVEDLWARGRLAWSDRP